MTDAVFDFVRREGFVELDTPEITPGTGACENVPTVFRLDFLGRLQFLRQTAQLDLEVAVARWGLPPGSTPGPSFRAEPRAGRRIWLERDLRPFNVISYGEAIRMLGREWGDDLSAGDEARLTEILGIVSVVRYPREIKFFNMLDTRENGAAATGAATGGCCDP